MEDNPFKRRAAEEKRRRQDEANTKLLEAKEKAKSKALVRRKAQRAVEDTWLNDGNEDDATTIHESDDDEEGGGLKMIDPMDFYGSGEATKPSPDSSKFKITNLIDFGACNQEEASTRSGSPDFLQSTSHMVSCAAGSGEMPHRHQEQLGGHEEELIAEIDNLKMMLSSSNEEKIIQIEILTEEKQKVIDDLRGRLETQATSESKLRAETVQLHAELFRRSASEEALRKELRALKAGHAVEQRRFQEEVTPSDQSPRAAMTPAAHANVIEVCIAVDSPDDLREVHGKLAEKMHTMGISRDRVAGEPGVSFVACGGKVTSVSGPEDLEIVELPGQMKFSFTINRESGSPGLAAQAMEGVPTLLFELRDLATSAHNVLAGGKSCVKLPQWSSALSLGDVECQLRDLRTVLARVKGDVETFPRKAATFPGKPADQASRDAALALQEVRFRAERQLAWIQKRVRVAPVPG